MCAALQYKLKRGTVANKPMEASYVGVLVLVLAIGTAAWLQALTRHTGIDPLPTKLPHPPARDGVYAPNTHLHHLQRLGMGLLPKPEDLLVSSDGLFLYAACVDGWIKEIHLPSGNVRNWTLVAGRPLGLAVGLHGEILACEPSLGLLNITEGKVTILSDSAGGIKHKFADGVAAARDDGSIYFTDASTKFGFPDSDFDILEARPHGRLLKYDASTGSTTVLLTDLYFPNGVAISLDQSFLVFCETAKVRCQRLWLKGSRRGELEMFIDNLPGYPDNIHVTRRGTFWIALVSDRSLLIEKIMGFPFVKRFILTPRVIAALDVGALMAKVLEVSDQGEPLQLLEDPNGKAIGFVTCALEHEDHLYLGGLAGDYIGKLKLEEVSPQH